MKARLNQNKGSNKGVHKDQTHDRGTVLLTTLLIMAVMAAITVALMDDIRIAVKRMLNIHAYAQADWQSRGAEDFIRAYLQTDFRALEPIEKAVLLQAKTPLILPTPEGVITVTLKDASHCFNLNLLVTESGEPNGRVRLQFVELAKLLGLPDNQAVSLSGALIDWQDRDQQRLTMGAEDGDYLRRDPPYRTADTALRSPEEMRAIQGMDEELWDLFRPFVCTGAAAQEDEILSVNINGLTPDRIILLAASLAGAGLETDTTELAQTLLRDRPFAGYSQAELNEKLSQLSVGEGSVQADVKSVFVEVVTEVGPAERVRTYRYDGLDKMPLRLTYRGWGRETFRPEIEPELEAR